MIIITTLLTLTTLADPPIVLAVGPARPVVVILDGQAITLTTVPLIGPGPAPGPAPIPPSPPEPTPVSGKLWVSLIVSANDAEQAHLRTHDAIRSLAKPSEIELRTYTHDDPALAGIKLAPYVDRIGLPLLVVQDDKGKVLDAGKVVDSAQVVATVRRYKP